MSNDFAANSQVVSPPNKK